MKILSIVLILILSFTLMYSFTGPEYVGAKKCKTCHNSKKQGEQYKIWSENRHSQAYHSLKTPEAAKKAEIMGVKDPLTDEKCLSCHAPAHNAKNIAKTFKIEDGVQCENCHGAGSQYKKMKTMKDREASVAAGMLIPDEKTCQNCHKADTPGHENKFTTFEKEFAKITHMVPAATDRRKKK